MAFYSMLEINATSIFRSVGSIFYYEGSYLYNGLEVFGNFQDAVIFTFCMTMFTTITLIPIFLMINTWRCIYCNAYIEYCREEMDENKICNCDQPPKGTSLNNDKKDSIYFEDSVTVESEFEDVSISEFSSLPEDTDSMNLIEQSSLESSTIEHESQDIDELKKTIVAGVLKEQRKCSPTNIKGIMDIAEMNIDVDCNLSNTFEVDVAFNKIINSEVGKSLHGFLAILGKKSNIEKLCDLITAKSEHEKCSENPLLDDTIGSDVSIDVSLDECLDVPIGCLEEYDTNIWDYNTVQSANNQWETKRKIRSKLSDSFTDIWEQ